jgi:hypothetical protein
VLDAQASSSQTAQLSRARNYSDETQRLDYPNPAGAPDWAYNVQESLVYDTEIEAMTDAE